ncbi:Peptidase family S49 [uncultured archaeon]|nr:Peptidase family S49 [uncultured archaeon]
MAYKDRAEPKNNNIVILVVGGLFLIAILVIIGYSFASGPFEGCVGVVSINGEIVSQDIPSSIFSDEVLGSETMAGEIASADSRSDVKSVLVLIDSPGGSVVGSKQIYDAVRALNKYSVSYINEMAASGGYYVAAGTDYIVANPDSITGSIGARATFTEMSGLFGKLGINETTIKTGAMKDIGSSSRPMTDDERALIQGIVNESFQQFKSDVEIGRGSRLNYQLFQPVLDARILSGRQAKKIGLVDALGDKKAAIKKAAELGGITSDDPRLCELSSTGAQRGLLGSLSAQTIDFLVRSSGMPKLQYR